MGDFYELFFEDAEVASRALGIILTKRGMHEGEDIRMGGVPVERAEAYLIRLIALGHQGRRLRADRGPGGGQEARRQIGGAARAGPRGDAGHAHRGSAARAGGARLLVAVQRSPPGTALDLWPARSISPPASSRCRTGRGGLAASWRAWSRARSSRRTCRRRAAVSAPDRRPARARTPMAQRGRRRRRGRARVSDSTASRRWTASAPSPAPRSPRRP